MTIDQFRQKYRGRFLLFLTEAWACRKMEAGSLGMMLDKHHNDLERLLEAIYKDLSPEPPAQPVQRAAQTQPAPNGAVRKTP